MSKISSIGMTGRNTGDRNQNGNLEYTLDETEQ